MSFLNENERLDLKKMVNKAEAKDMTERIRKLKHSKLIKNDVNKIINMKLKYSRLKKNMLNDMAIKQCNFLFTNYTNIFNKLLNDSIDVKLLDKFLGILNKIEMGEYNQHEASVLVGKVLKEIYIDSAIKEQTKYENSSKMNKNIKRNRKNVKISWSEYKQLKNV